MKLISKIASVFLVLSMVFHTGFTQSTSKYHEKIIKARIMVKEFMEKEGVPGLSVSLSIDHKMVWSEGFGYANLEQKTAVYPGFTKFRIGSVSKTLTATAIGLLVEQNRLDLDLPVQSYVPEFPKKQWTITSRQLGGHIAGIRHYKKGEFLSTKFYKTVGEGLDIFKDDELLFEPETDYSYSSYGWNLLSAVIENAAGVAFLQYMQEEVFDAIGMPNTVPEYMDQLIDGRTNYYEKDGKGKILNAPYVDNSYKWAGGGFIGTTEDLVAFGEAMLKHELLNAKTVQILQAPQKTKDGKSTNYGIGWRSGTDNQGHPWTGHSGGSVGGTTQFVIFPEEKIVIAITGNLSGLPFRGVHLKIANIFMD